MNTLTAKRITLTAALTTAAASLALVLYWLFTASLEDIETPFLALGLSLLCGLLAETARRGRVTLAAWGLLLLLGSLNLANLSAYGIGTTSSAGLILLIPLAMFALGRGPGWGVTLVSCAFLFLLAGLGSAGLWQPPYQAFQASNLSFDAPVLSLIFLLTAAFCHVVETQ